MIVIVPVSSPGGGRLLTVPIGTSGGKSVAPSVSRRPAVTIRSPTFSLPTFGDVDHLQQVRVAGVGLDDPELVVGVVDRRRPRRAAVDQRHGRGARADRGHDADEAVGADHRVADAHAGAAAGVDRDRARRTGSAGWIVTFAVTGPSAPGCRAGRVRAAAAASPFSRAAAPAASRASERGRCSSLRSLSRWPAALKTSSIHVEQVVHRRQHLAGARLDRRDDVEEARSGRRAADPCPSFRSSR